MSTLENPQRLVEVANDWKTIAQALFRRFRLKLIPSDVERAARALGYGERVSPNNLAVRARIHGLDKLPDGEEFYKAH